jgi:hypothetical protein
VGKPRFVITEIIDEHDDNGCCLLTSANLNKSYFVNRQDRYLKLQNCSDLCQFFVDIIETLGAQSFKVQTRHAMPIFMGKHHPYEGKPIVEYYT